ncbi:POTRA domain-containing protein [Aureivirga marina]|uniref:POTRA domain-containing protein n=1 Tax=Aureivirga marina TaxID=1182451 RepID=UPI0018CB961C|nr:POTRA domain-containing protein [Aureivirga marina]
MKNLNIKPLYLLFFSILFLFNAKIYSQNIILKAIDSENNAVEKNKDFTYKNNFKNVDSLNLEIEKIQKKLQLEGFYNSYLKNKISKKDTITAIFDLGKKIDKLILRYKEEQITDLNFSSNVKIENNTIIASPKYIEQILNTIVSYFENQGNSFSNVYLYNLNQKDGNLYANLQVEKSNQRHIDSIIIEGYKSFPKSFIKHKLQLKKGSVFTKDKLKTASTVLKSIPFVEEIKSPQILFTKDTTAIYLYLKKRNRNIFDGLIGFNSNEDDGKLRLNGHLRLELFNMFNNGEEIKIFWESFPEEKTMLNVGGKIPYIFNSPVSPSVNLEIFKQDSTFVSTKFNFELSYSINHKNELSGFYNSESSSNLLNNSLSNLTVEDFTNNFYGIRYNYIEYNDSYLQPRKFYLELKPSIGTRKAEETIAQQKISGSASYLWLLNRKNYLYIRNISAHLNSSNYIFNELFRIGGANSIRGFNESSIFVSTYSLFNIEYRYLLSDLSYLYSITDFAYTNNEIDNVSDNAYGLGIGYVYFKNNSKINISYAVGSFGNENFDFNNSKFHIKFTYFF